VHFTPHQYIIVNYWHLFHVQVNLRGREGGEVTENHHGNVK